MNEKSNGPCTPLCGGGGLLISPRPRYMGALGRKGSSWLCLGISQGSMQVVSLPCSRELKLCCQLR